MEYVPAARAEESVTDTAEPVEREVFSQNLTPGESKPHAFTGETSRQTSQNLTGNSPQSPEVLREVSFARVSPNVSPNVVGGFKESLSSENVINVAAENLTKNLTPPNLTENLTENLTQNLTPSATPVLHAPLPRPALALSHVAAARFADVKNVLAATGDDPEKWQAMWNRVWKHCHATDQLRCWDEAVIMLAHRIKVSPPSGPGSIGNKGTWLRGTMWALLGKAGVPYLTLAQAKADAQAETIDDGEVAEIRRQALEIKAQWEAEDAARSAGITPLDRIYTEGDSDPGSEE